MKFLSLITAVCLIAAASSSFAQSPPPPPKNPMVHHVPEFASWTIAYTYKPVTAATATAGSPPLPATTERLVQNVTVTKTQKTYEVQTEWSNGDKDEQWIYNGEQYKTANNGRSIVLVHPPAPDDPSPDYLDYGHHDFTELEWVSISNYTGVQPYQGKQVYVFESAKSEDKKVAYLSTETQLPLFSSDGNVSCTYTYNPPPTAPLVPPKRFLDVIEAHKAGVRALQFHPSPP